MRISTTTVKWLQVGLAALILAILLFFVFTPPATAFDVAIQPGCPDPTPTSRGANT